MSRLINVRAHIRNGKKVKAYTKGSTNKKSATTTSSKGWTEDRRTAGEKAKFKNMGDEWYAAREQKAREIWKKIKAIKDNSRPPKTGKYWVKSTFKNGEPVLGYWKGQAGKDNY